jgi:carbon-monoxide dehydrogenase large subunit
MPGVGAVLTADDVRDLGDLPCLFNFEVDPFTGPPYPILPKDEVRHVGDAVAFVVADTIDQARDAIEAIEVNWTPLPAVVGVVNAVKKGAPQVWPKHEGNILFDVPIGDKKATDAAFAKAHAVAEVSIVNPRVITNFMETRAAVVEYDAKRDHLTLTVGSQGSHRLREIIAGMVLKMPMEKMRVICPDVGGGFGTKLFPYREYALLAVAAKKLRKTIKWTADRSDHFMGDAQGRDNVTRMDLALASNPFTKAGLNMALWDALDQLKPKSRAAVVLRYYHDYDYAMIAGILNTTSTNVGAMLSRALDRLKNALEPEPGAVAEAGR